MATKSSELQNRGETPESLRGESQMLADMQRVKHGPPPEPDVVEPAKAEPRTLEQRIAAARELRPPRGIEDGRCWGMGRDAAIAAIDQPQG